MNSSMIRFENISFSFGTKEILKNLSFSIPAGKTFGLVGESGSGKTTTLRIMNGLLRPNNGKVFLDNREFDFSEGEKWRRQMGYSIQGSGLFPHMNLEKNINIIGRKAGWSREQLDTRLSEVCRLVNLPYESTFLRKLPRQISGGQQQRVGIARALFMSPKILLMDEPFGALDPITREEIQNEFLALQDQLQLTIVLVTHDLTEAFRMCDQVIILHEGQLAQIAKPSELLVHPATPYVARFIQTHSPGHMLKSVKLYSVISGDVLTTCRAGDGFKLKRISDEQGFFAANETDLLSRHSQQHQQFIYWVDRNGKFLGFQQASERSFGDMHEARLSTRDDILFGMKQIMASDLPLFPVVGNDGVMVGVFSKGALDAL